MDKNNTAKRIIEQKKLNGSKRKPKYATRKLSIGLVSCMLGYALLVSPSSAEAAELDNNQEVVEELVDTKEESTSEENVVEEKETPVEETLSDEQAIEEKETQEAPVEDKVSEEVAPEETVEEETSNETIKEDKKEENASELEMDEEAKPKPVVAGEKKITDIQGTIDGNIRSGITKVKPLAKDAGEDYDTILKTAFSFGVPDTITGGDTFEVKVSDNVNLHGISKDSVIDDLYYNGELLAKAEVQADGRTIIYRFTDYVDKIANIKMNISFPLFIDKVNVPENSTEEVVVTIDGNQISKTFEVDYSRDGYYKSEEEDVETLSGKANLDTVTDTDYHHTIYVNTNNQELTNSQLRIRNQDGTDGAIFDQDVLDSLKVYRLNDGKQLKGSFNLDYNDLTDVTENATIRKALDEKMGILVDINQKNDKASYVVVYDGKRKEKTSLNTIVEFGAASKKRMDGTPEGTVPIADRNWSWKSDVYFDDGDGSATGDEKPEVYKLGDTVWYDDNGNGIQDEGEKPAANVYVTINIDGQKISLRTDENGKYTFNNLPNGEYELTFSNFDGYKITTPNVGDNDELDSDGILTDGVVRAKGTINGADNMSVDLGLVAIPGSFQEHHVYLTKDEDGNVIDAETITEDGKVKEGTKDQTYPTGKKDKEGYKFVRTENAVNEPTYNKDGSAAEGNFKPGEKQEITYVYERTITTKGTFQEHHVYLTKDEDGNVIDAETITEDGEVKEGTKDQTYPTGKKDKEGYKFVRTEDAVNEPTYNKDGSAAEGNFKPGEKQEITYVYERTITTKGSFQEHHVYLTKDEDGNVIDAETITEDGEVKEGTKDQTYPTGKKDKEGYKFVRTEDAVNEPTYNEDGSAAEGNFKPGEKQEITYVYERTITTKGSFQEHHVYLTKDEDGNVIDAETITEDGEVKEGTKDQTYPTGKKDKEGYKFVRTENPVNEPTYNENGEATEGNFKPGEKQEITYVYERTEVKQTPLEETGKFQEHHIYITKDKDGKEIKREVVDGKVSGGTKDMTYTTGKVDKDGFKFVRTENPVEEPTFNEKGEETKGNYKPGEKQEITYVYEKTESEWTPIEETGKFQEHHIYITKDKDGKEIKREVVDGKVTGGTKDMTYTTGKAEKDGFKFVRTENPVEEPTFNEKGETTKGNYKPGVKQEITYVYEKTESEWTPIEETGKFQEHHIYITKDKDGKEIKREVVDGKVSGGSKDMTYTTGKDEKDGFKFVRTENAVEEPSYNEQGEETKGNYKPGVKQEITYVYEKTESEWTPIEETGKFQEHHIYITKDKDGKEIGREVVDGKVSGGTKDMTYTTGKVDKDGYKLVKVENPVGDPSYDKDGKETKGNYKPGVKQEITYVYEKIEKETTKPVEPKKPEEPNKPGKVETGKETGKKEDIYQVKYVKPESANVETGVGSVSGIVATLSAAVGGLFVSKKRKNK